MQSIKNPENSYYVGTSHHLPTPGKPGQSANKKTLENLSTCNHQTKNPDKKNPQKNPDVGLYVGTWGLCLTLADVRVLRTCGSPELSDRLILPF